MTATDNDSGVEPRMSKSAATRARIVAAAGKVLAESGYQHTRLTAIATAAGMQTGSLYYYFDSKEQLVEEVLDGGARLAHERVRAAATAVPDASAGARLSAALRAFIAVRLEIGAVSTAHIRNYRELPEDMRERLRPELEAFSRLWDELVLAAVESGEIRADVDPRTLHLFAVHTSEQIATWPSSARSTTDTVDVMFRLMLNGLVGPGGD
ncbi:TetR/AcrR family transcriptional regulator [Nocardia asteroides]|uniref:TetR/AcrR family transcriptional regulator n=1 Tax=Nocardia asteroides TaxID=1824 RepID=UPI0037CBAB82